MAQAITGQVALITGAGKRIGRETALTLAGAGAHIVAHYNTSADDAESLCREVEALGVSAWAVAGDFSTPDGYEGLVDRAWEAAGRLDILVNNASIFPRDTLGSVTWASVTDNLEINAWAPFVLGRAFAGRVTEGHIVNLLDSRVWGYDWQHVGYILSKHMLTTLTRMMAVEFAPAVAVNGVAPGLILPPPGESEAYLDKLIYTVPLKRHGDAQDIADAVHFLVTSRFISGEVLFIDGGRHLMEYHRGSHPH